VNVNGDYDAHSASDDSADVVINIFNGVGQPRVGRQLEYKCQVGHGECRPQCPEARFNSDSQEITINWAADTAGCDGYFKPENTVITLFAPST
jgi:hypothetical protein